MTDAWRFSLLGYPVGLRPAALPAPRARRDRARAWRADRRVPAEDEGPLARLRRASPRSSRPGSRSSGPRSGSRSARSACSSSRSRSAQPQCGSRSELTKRRGIDVVVALDASKSMLARDVQPTRLERAKLELTTLLDELKGDRVGHRRLRRRRVHPVPAHHRLRRGEAVPPRGRPRRRCPRAARTSARRSSSPRQLLDRADRGAKDRVVVLLSDGEDLSGEVDDAVDALKKEGIRVYAVGIGSRERRADPGRRPPGRTWSATRRTRTATR